MNADKNNSWKKKIDPAFDDLIKVYLHYIEHSHICSADTRKRYLSLDDKSLKVLKRKGYPPLLKKFKANRRSLRKLLNSNIALGASHDSMLILEYFSNLEKLVKNEEKKKSKKENENKYFDAIESNVIGMINGLPREDSRKYYKERFTIDLSEEEMNAFFKTKTEDEIIRFLCDVVIDINCLTLQTGFKDYWDSPSENCNDKGIGKSRMINIAMRQIYNSISIMTYRKSLLVLCHEAKYNDESLFNAIHLDKTLFDKDWVRKRINKAFYSGDSRFFNELAKAIKKPPISAKVDRDKLITILSSLWPFGLYRLDNNELMDLLKTCGVPIQKNKESFRRFVDNLKENNILVDIDKLITVKKSRM